jgi:anti-sigma B factor antagonist
MELQAIDLDDITRVALTGRLDTAGVSRIETRFTAVIVPKGQHAVVDLSEVGFLASLGVRMLISTTRALSGKGGKLALYGANEAVMEIIETTSLHEIVPVAATEAEAIALVKS